MTQKLASPRGRKRATYALELMRNYLMKRGLEDELWQWCDNHGITRRGYYGANKLDGNNASRFLTKVEGLRTAAWFPGEAEPIVDCLLEFRKVKDSCFGWDIGITGERISNLTLPCFLNSSSMLQKSWRRPSL